MQFAARAHGIASNGTASDHVVFCSGTSTARPARAHNLSVTAGLPPHVRITALSACSNGANDPPRNAGFAAAAGRFLLGRVCRAAGWITLAATLAACMPPPVSRSTPLPSSGPILQFPSIQALPASRPNGQIAQDFLDLEFHLESGQTLPALSRFEGPITLTLIGQVPATAAIETQKLITRLQIEAGIDIDFTQDPANITVQFAPRSALERLDPSAACFVAPNVSSLSEYRAKRGSHALDWQNIRIRQRLAIFIASDTSPQEQRDCLHEELAQALGPLNDLYRLPDSVFNDDNFLSTLTGFDMLVLRIHYARELAPGMTQPQVAARLPDLLLRLNPAGERPGHWDNPGTPRAFIDAVDAALGPKGTRASRRAAARQMLALSQGWQDARTGLAYFALGRLQDPQNIAEAVQDFQNAAAIFIHLPDGGARLAHALLQLAAIDLASGLPDQAIAKADQALPLAGAAQNAALIANLSLLKAQALTEVGQTAAGQALRIDSLPATRYGFGSVPTGALKPGQSRS